MTLSFILKIIKEARKHQNINQTAMAQKLGITQTQYSNYESGKSEISLSKFLEIIEILDLDFMKQGIPNISKVTILSLQKWKI